VVGNYIITQNYILQGCGRKENKERLVWKISRGVGVEKRKWPILS